MSILGAFYKTIASILSSKGDILGFSTTEGRLAVGANDTVLTADSSQTLGIKWAVAGGSGLWSVLGTYEASSEEASKTFTFTSIDFDDDAALLLIIDGTVSNGTNTLEIQVDGDTSASYDGQTIQMLQGTQTLADIQNQTSAVIAPAALFAESPEGFFAIVWISLHKPGSQDRPMINASTVAPAQRGSLQFWGSSDTGHSDIASVTILSQANWEVGTRMTLYKVARA